MPCSRTGRSIALSAALALCTNFAADASRGADHHERPGATGDPSTRPTPAGAPALALGADLDLFDVAPLPRLPRTRHERALEWTREETRLVSNISWVAAQSATSQVESASADAAADGPDLDAIGEAMANPLSYLWLMFMQNDTIWNEGNVLDDLGLDAKPQNIFLLNPVLSIQLTEKWKTIVRPVIPINAFNTVDNVGVSADNPGGLTGVDRERTAGLGDIVLWTAFSNMYKPPFIFGFGPTFMFDTATDEQLGTGKNSAGPMALAFYLSDKWILGTVAQHWWSFSGESNINVQTGLGTVSVDRPGVNLTDVQPVIRYRLSQKTNIGIAPNWRYNWKTEQLDLPIGIGGDSLFMIGKLPVKIGVEAYYHVVRDDDFGPEWQLRFLFIPVLPSPAWSREPIF